MEYSIKEYAFYLGNEAERLRNAPENEQINFLNERFNNVYTEMTDIYNSYLEAMKTGEIKTLATFDDIPNKKSLKKWVKNYNNIRKSSRMIEEDFTGDFYIIGIEKARDPFTQNAYAQRGAWENSTLSRLRLLLEEAICIITDEERKDYMANDETAILSIELNKLINDKGNMNLPIKQEKNKFREIENEKPPFWEIDEKKTPLTKEQMNYLIKRYSEMDNMLNSFFKETANNLSIKTSNNDT